MGYLGCIFVYLFVARRMHEDLRLHTERMSKEEMCIFMLREKSERYRGNDEEGSASDSSGRICLVQIKSIRGG